MCVRGGKIPSKEVRISQDSNFRSGVKKVSVVSGKKWSSPKS